MMRIAAIGLALCLVGCGQGEQAVNCKQSKGSTNALDVSKEGGKRTVASPDGVLKAEETLGGKNARFPAFAPQYPCAIVQSVTDFSAGSSVKQHIITMRTEDSPEAVMAFYKEKAAANGKQAQYNGNRTDALEIGGTSSLDLDAFVTAKASPSGGTWVSVTVMGD